MRLRAFELFFRAQKQEAIPDDKKADARPLFLHTYNVTSIFCVKSVQA